MCTCTLYNDCKRKNEFHLLFFFANKNYSATTDEVANICYFDIYWDINALSLSCCRDLYVLSCWYIHSEMVWIRGGNETNKFILSRVIVSMEGFQCCYWMRKQEEKFISVGKKKLKFHVIFLTDVFKNRKISNKWLVLFAFTSNCKDSDWKK